MLNLTLLAVLSTPAAAFDDLAASMEESTLLLATVEDLVGAAATDDFTTGVVELPAAATDEPALDEFASFEDPALDELAAFEDLTLDDPPPALLKPAFEEDGGGFFFGGGSSSSANIM